MVVVACIDVNQSALKLRHGAVRPRHDRVLTSGFWFLVSGFWFLVSGFSKWPLLTTPQAERFKAAAP